VSDFKAKMHQIRFRLGLPLAGFKGPTFKGREGRGGEGRGGRREGRGGERERRGRGTCSKVLRGIDAPVSGCKRAIVCAIRKLGFRGGVGRVS